jgi:hypothetical protein
MLVAVLGAGAVALLAAGCRQAEGDRCEVDSDCQTGLTCDNPLLTGGQCTSRSGSTVITPDAARPVDTAVPDTARPSGPEAGPADRPVDVPPPVADAASDAGNGDAARD